MPGSKRTYSLHISTTTWPTVLSRDECCTRNKPPPLQTLQYKLFIAYCLPLVYSTIFEWLHVLVLQSPGRCLRTWLPGSPHAAHIFEFIGRDGTSPTSILSVVLLVGLTLELQIQQVFVIVVRPTLPSNRATGH
jgi:hypothetical protein